MTGSEVEAGVEELADRLTAADVEVERGAGGWRALPTDAEAVARIVRAASALERPPLLVPTGGGTRLADVRADLAGPDAWRAALRVDTARLAGVVEYVPGDGTLTALAGTPWEELARVVAEGGHELTPDASPAGSRGATGARSTLGGVLGAGASGPDRLRHGPLGHHVLGALVATGSGTLARSGGRLVKNVTGFDVFRLHVGGRGTLGVVVEASLRLVPRAEHEALLSLEGIEARDAFALLTAVRGGPVQPRATWATATRGPGWRVAVQLTGRARQVEADAARVADVLGASHARVDGEAAREAARNMRDLRTTDGALGALRLEVASVPSAADAVRRELTAWGASHRLDGPPRFVAWPGVARLEVGLPAPTGEAAARGPLAELVGRLAPLGARVAWAGGAPAAAEALADAAPAPATRWQSALSERLDPSRLFAARRAASLTTT